MQPESPSDLIAGADLTRGIDALFVNAPLRDYDVRPRVNDFTLPVLGIEQTARLVNAAAPRWAGFNLLAPTYEISARIAERLDRDIMLVLGGHQAKAMPAEILFDQRMSQCEALVIGEGETWVAALLDDHRRRNELPGVMWLDAIMHTPVAGGMGTKNGPQPAREPSAQCIMIGGCVIVLPAHHVLEFRMSPGAAARKPGLCSKLTCSRPGERRAGELGTSRSCGRRGACPEWTRPRCTWFHARSGSGSSVSVNTQALNARARNAGWCTDLCC